MPVELHCHSCYSFLDGASHPEELVQRAADLGYTALALTDHNGLYGSLEFAQAAHAAGLQPITGAEVTLEDETHLTLLAETAAGYSNLCRLLSTAHRDAERRAPRLSYQALARHTGGLIALSGCREGKLARLVDAGRCTEAERMAREYQEWFGVENYFLEVQQNYVRGDTARLRTLGVLGQRLEIPLVATGNTHYHVPERYRLQDTLVAIRHGLTLYEARRQRRANREFALPTAAEWERRFRGYADALENAEAVAERCRKFDLIHDLGYRFPDFLNEAEDHQFRTADEALRLLCDEALAVKYASEQRERQREAREWLENELRLVALHGLAGFFLVYRDLLQMSKQVAAELRGTGARGRFDLPPGRGRGSAVSSIICYLIGLSPVDPIKAKLFPARFLNEALASVPDIDLDFPRDIREELIRRVHQHYGEDHVAMVCIFPTYKFRSTVREVGMALDLPADEIDRLAKTGDGWSQVPAELERSEALAGQAPSGRWRHLLELSEQVAGMPRHLSQHVGGLVISSRPLVELVPIEHSAMDGRQVCQWDKDSVDLARFIKIDFLALGMLSAVEESLELIEANGKPVPDLARLDFQDPRVFNRICRGETIGAFQVESRAQVGMCVRTRPRTMEDLAIQIAIVRPGPVVANAVNPYVRERERQRLSRRYQPRFDHPCLKEVLADTLGIIIYQDQVMEVAKAMAGFTDGEADQLRRAMSRKRSKENMERFRGLFLEGARRNGVPEEVAARVFEKVFAFSEFGFPKSHSAAFAVLAYQSVWLLEYHPAEFYAALINNQPMGFYAVDTLIKEAQRRVIVFRAPDINRSQLTCTVLGKTVQLGLSLIKGVQQAIGQALLAERAARGEFRSLPDLIRRMRLSDAVLENLIHAGALDGWGLNRRELLWQLGLLGFHRGEQFKKRTPERWLPAGRQDALDLPTEQDQVQLPAAGAWERMGLEYRVMQLSVESHPLRLLRPALSRQIVPIRKLRECRHNSMVEVAGLVTTRQRPETAKGILFLLLEDETGMLNVVVKPDLHEAHRQLYRREPLLVVRGVLEQQAQRLNLLALEAWPLVESLPDAMKSAAGRRAQRAVDRFAGPPSHNFR